MHSDIFKVGVAGGPSPWKSVLNGLDPQILCGGNDIWMVFFTIPYTKQATDEAVLKCVQNEFRLDRRAYFTTALPEQMDQRIKECRDSKAAAEAKV